MACQGGARGSSSVSTSCSIPRCICLRRSRQIEYPASSPSRTHRYIRYIRLYVRRSPPGNLAVPTAARGMDENGVGAHPFHVLRKTHSPLFSWLLLVLRTNAPLTCAPYHPHRRAKQTTPSLVHFADAPFYRRPQNAAMRTSFFLFPSLADREHTAVRPKIRVHLLDDRADRKLNW